MAEWRFREIKYRQDPLRAYKIFPIFLRPEISQSVVIMGDDRKDWTNGKIGNFAKQFETRNTRT